MVQKRFGPSLGAGTVIIEKESEKTIQASAFGSTAYTGVLERGEIGELIGVSGKRDLLAKTGGYIPDSLLPDTLVDFWDHSNGAGVMFLYRVTDGKEVKGSLTLYDRKATLANANARNAVARIDAKNGGGWGGRRQTWVFDVATPGTDITETVIKAPTNFSVKKDQFKGGTLTLTGASSSFEIIGNDASTGAAVTNITLAADSLADTLYGVSTDPEVIIEVSSLDGYGQAKNLALEVRDGVLNPSTEWGLFVHLNGGLVREYPNLSSDPNSDSYFVDLINEDGANHYIAATDLWVGAITADVRPANHFGQVASGSEITTSKLKTGTATVSVDSSLAVDNTITTITFGSKVIADRYEVEVASVGPTVWTCVSLDQQVEHAFTAPADAVAYTADNPYAIGFTVSGVTPVVGEKFTLTVVPHVEDETIGGRIFYPDLGAAPAGGFLITDNTETEADISTGDLTLAGTVAGNVKYRLQYKQQMGFGYDGIAEIDNNDFLPAYDINTSPFNETADKGYGLIKFSTPGITDYGSPVVPTTVEKAGMAYAEAKNHQYREEIPKSITDDFAAKSHVQDTLGKNTYAKVIFPSWCSVSDPIFPSRLKEVPVTGMVQGREALVAKNFEGYHKAAAGVDVKLPRIVKLPTLDRILDQEILNPAGLQMIVKKGGNFVVWGDRAPVTDQAFKFAHHREQLSYYEHVIIESFDFIMFAINDKAEQPGLIAAFNSFFLPEWRKRALRGDNPKQAFSIKIDDENNTDLTRAAGEMNAEIKLKLAETVERFIVTISKAGVFEDLET